MPEEKQNAKTPRRRGAKRREREREFLRSEAPSLQRVPRLQENSSAEDDGYLIDILSHEEKSYLLIIDASTMQEVAKLHIPQRVPYGVHACWLDENKIKALGES